MMTGFVLSNVTIIDINNGSKSLCDIRVTDDRIAQIEPSGSMLISPSIQVINADGKFVIPGLCDMHIHLTAWPSFTDRISSLLIAYGITSVRDMGGKLDEILKFRQQASKPNAIAPRMWIAGPIIDGSPKALTADQSIEMPDISVAVDTPEEASALINELIASKVDFIKTYEMLRPDVFKVLVEQAQSVSMRVAGHLPMLMTISEVLEICQYDIQHIVGGNCSGMAFECTQNQKELMIERVSIMDKITVGMSGTDVARKIISSAALNPLELDSGRRSELIQLFVEEETWNTPTLVVMAGVHALGIDRDEDWIKAFRYLPYDIQNNAQTIRNNGESSYHSLWSDWYLETVGEMDKAGVKLLAGTDCPPVCSYTPGLSLHFELQALVLAGLSPLAALQTATLNASEFFDATEDLGSVEVGKYADMVLLDADPLDDINNTKSIAAVVSRGKIYDRQTLDEILSDLENM